MQCKILKFQLGMKHKAGKATARLPLRSKESIVQNVIEQDIHRRNVGVHASGVKRLIIQVIDALISLRMKIM